MRWRNLRTHTFPALVIIGDLNVVRVPVVPAKADAVLFVDTDAMLTLAVSPKLLEAVAEWHAKIV
jgi:hypothetical protein